VVEENAAAKIKGGKVQAVVSEKLRERSRKRE